MFEPPLRMFVIGIGGQLSTALIERAGDHGFVVETLGFPDLDLAAPVETIECHVREAATLRRLQAPDQDRKSVV